MSGAGPPALTRDGVSRLRLEEGWRSDVGGLSAEPLVLQLTQLRRFAIDRDFQSINGMNVALPPCADAFELTLSDGKGTKRCVLSTLLNRAVYRGKLKPHAVLRVAKFKHQRALDQDLSEPPTVVLTDLEPIGVADGVIEAVQGAPPAATDRELTSDSPIAGARRFFLRLECNSVLVTDKWRRDPSEALDLDLTAAADERREEEDGGESDEQTLDVNDGPARKLGRAAARAPSIQAVLAEHIDAHARGTRKNRKRTAAGAPAGGRDPEMLVGRVVRKGALTHFAKPEHTGKESAYPIFFSLALQDSEGGEIELSVWNYACVRFWGAVQLGEVVLATHFRMKPPRVHSGGGDEAAAPAAARWEAAINASNPTGRLLALSADDLRGLRATALPARVDVPVCQPWSVQQALALSAEHAEPCDVFGVLVHATEPVRLAVSFAAPAAPAAGRPPLDPAIASEPSAFAYGRWLTLAAAAEPESGARAAAGARGAQPTSRALRVWMEERACDQLGGAAPIGARPMVVVLTALRVVVGGAGRARYARCTPLSLGARAHKLLPNDPRVRALIDALRDQPTLGAALQSAHALEPALLLVPAPACALLPRDAFGSKAELAALPLLAAPSALAPAPTCAVSQLAEVEARLHAQQQRMVVLRGVVRALHARPYLPTAWMFELSVSDAADDEGAPVVLAVRVPIEGAVDARARLRALLGLEEEGDGVPSAYQPGAPPEALARLVFAEIDGRQADCAVDLHFRGGDDAVTRQLAAAFCAPPAGSGAVGRGAQQR